MLASLVRATRAELMKLCGLPGIVITLLATMGGPAAVARGLQANAIQAGQAATSTQLLASTTSYAAIGFVMFGVLAATSEYSSGQVARTLLSMPTRGTVVVAKVLASAILGIGCAVVAVVVAGLVLGELDPRQAVMIVGYLATMGLIAVAIGLLLRHLVLALTAAMLVLVVAPPLLEQFAHWGRWLPTTAGTQLFADAPARTMSVVTAGCVVASWAVAMWLLASMRWMRSDA